MYEPPLLALFHPQIWKLWSILPLSKLDLSKTQSEFRFYPTFVLDLTQSLKGWAMVTGLYWQQIFLWEALRDILGNVRNLEPGAKLNCIPSKITSVGRIADKKFSNLEGGDGKPSYTVRFVPHITSSTWAGKIHCLIDLLNCSQGSSSLLKYETHPPMRSIEMLIRTASKTIPPKTWVFSSL